MPDLPPTAEKGPKVALSDVKGSSYGPTIKAQLDEERATKASLEARGLAIITSSSVLATLLFGLVAFTRGNVNQAHLDVGVWAGRALLLGVALFALAALLGLWANLPLKYKEADVEVLRERVQPKEWTIPDPIEAARYDAVLNVQVLDRARKANALKAQVLTFSIAAEALGAVAVAVAVGSELWSLTGWSV
jgi:hypothetical protein